MPALITWGFGEKIPKSSFPKYKKIAPRMPPITIMQPWEIQTIF